MNTQTIWIVEFAPLPPQSVGGFDWYYTYEIAIRRFDDHRNNGALKSHQIGIYSVRLPGSWDRHQIQAWTEDNTNVLPECPDQEHIQLTSPRLMPVKTNEPEQGTASALRR